LVIGTIWKAGLMPVPAGALFRCHVRLDKVRNDLAVGRFGDANSARALRRCRR
jgi:hypothetical protein